MDSKENAFRLGFQSIPHILATSRRYTPAEKIVLMKIFDMMWKNNEDKTWKETCFPSNAYLSHFCSVSIKTIMRLKRKVKTEGLFTIIKGMDSPDIWKLNEIPPQYIEEYYEMLSEWESRKEISINEIADTVSDLEGDELEDYIENLNESTGKKYRILGKGENVVKGGQFESKDGLSVESEAQKPPPKYTDLSIQSLNKHNIISSGQNQEEFPFVENGRFRDFFSEFKQHYRNAIGSEYHLTAKDKEKLLSVEQSFIDSEIAILEKLIPCYFNSRDSFITDSDYSIYYFFVDNIQNYLRSRYHQSNEGRWTAQAEKIYNDLDLSATDAEDIEGFIRQNVSFPGASTERDKFVFDYLKKKIEEEIVETTQLTGTQSLFIDRFSKAYQQLFNMPYLPDLDDHQRLSMTDDNLMKQFLELDAEFDVFEAWFGRNGDITGQKLAVLLKSGDLPKLVREYRIIHEYQKTKGIGESIPPIARARSP